MNVNISLFDKGIQKIYNHNICDVGVITMAKREIIISQELHSRLIEKEREIKSNHSRLYYPFFKRMADICCSIAALIVMLILLPFVAIAIKVDSKGPVFFSQPRVGQYGEVIKIYKFRTMCVDAEKLIDKSIFKNRENPFLQRENDERVTKVGAVLRKFSIDELPQLFCVLKGDMSFIGPRPFIKEETMVLNEEQMMRLAIKPGLTGLAQISGRNDLNLQQRIDRDLEYSQTMSAGLDIKILWKTIIRVLRSDGAS